MTAPLMIRTVLPQQILNVTKPSGQFVLRWKKHHLQIWSGRNPQAESEPPADACELLALLRGLDIHREVAGRRPLLRISENTKV